MTAGISILSFAQHTSRAALLGPLTGADSEFLAQHLEELTGNVVLECGSLDDLDDSSAAVLLEFRESRSAQGCWVFFRGIPPRCSEKLLALARRWATCPEQANRSNMGWASQLASMGIV